MKSDSGRDLGELKPARKIPIREAMRKAGKLQDPPTEGNDFPIHMLVRSLRDEIIRLRGNNG
jgi:hypothetical protein